MKTIYLALALLLASALSSLAQNVEAVQRAFSNAGDNSAELARALKEVPKDWRSSMVFLIENMPDHDLRSVKAAYLLEHVQLAHKAMESIPWAKSIPHRVFLNDILPYANVDEPRDDSRGDLQRRFLPLVLSCKTPGEAAQVLNKTIFGELGVKYSTQRKRANQNPTETIEQGMASCTGLAILLTNTCRACGIPARLAGVASWKKKEGNHTWVEVWDRGWHFTGAAEPSKKGLGHAWFQADVAHAVRGSKEHGVWAASWAKTENTFPLAWDLTQRDVFAVEVTDRYVTKAAPKVQNTVRLMIEVRNAAGARVETSISLVKVGSKRQMTGTSRSETADTNDICSFDVPRGGTWRLQVAAGAGHIVQTWRAAKDDQETIQISLPRPPATLSATQSRALTRWFTKTFKAMSAGTRIGGEQDSLRLFLKDPAAEAAIRELAWSAYIASPLGQRQHANFKRNEVRHEKWMSPYTVKDVGTRPTNGWPLVIALHGGGNAPKSLNDSQWRHMQIYYKDHPEAGGYRYVALRAPNDTWNGFYDDYVYPLIANLIRQFLVHGDVDANRVHVIGYSHGGYGAFSIAPKIPHRFAAAHASASAPTDRQTSARSLRNLPFSFMVGGRDTAFGRADRCKKFAAKLEALQATDSQGWPTAFQWKPRHGHGGLPDRDHLPRLLLHRRTPVPTVLDWELTDKQVRSHYWLSTHQPLKNRSVRASLVDNCLKLETAGEVTVSALLDCRLVDFSKPLQIEHGDYMLLTEMRPSLTVLAESIHARGDRHLAGTVRVPVLVR